MSACVCVCACVLKRQSDSRQRGTKAATGCLQHTTDGRPLLAAQNALCEGKNCSATAEEVLWAYVDVMHYGPQAQMIHEKKGHMCHLRSKNWDFTELLLQRGWNLYPVCHKIKLRHKIREVTIGNAAFYSQKKKKKNPFKIARLLSNCFFFLT